MLTLGCLGATIGTFRLLTNQRASIVPIVSCISFGFSMAMLGTAIMRYRGSLRLEQYQLSRHPEGARRGGTNKVAAAEAPEGGEKGDAASPSAAAALLPLSPVKAHLRVLACVLALKQRGAAGWLQRDSETCAHNSSAGRSLLYSADCTTTSTALCQLLPEVRPVVPSCLHAQRQLLTA